MNRKLFFALMLGSIILISSGCKYEEGPIASLVSRTDRIAQVWVASAATNADGEEDLDRWDNWEWDFQASGDVVATTKLLNVPINFSGEWNLLDQDQNFQVLLKDGLGATSFDYEYEIIKLTQTEFWLRNVDDADETLYLVVKEE
ncbi:MAG: hypothetical protein AAFV07_02915 [Bacteroidota bacterium]